MLLNAVVMAEKPKNEGVIAAQTASRKPVEAGVEPDFNALLLDVAENRDKGSFIKLYEHFAPRIKSFLMRGGTTSEEADELAQETMLSVWHKAGSFKPEKAAASTWIYTIARNKKIDALRKAGRRETALPEHFSVVDDGPGQGDMLYSTQEREMISTALDSLPKEQSDLLEKSFFEHKSHSEIAKETGLPLGTIKSRIRLALQKLQQNKSVRALR